MDKNIFIKQSFMLWVGLVLPIILMLFYFAIYRIMQPRSISPMYNMVFYAEDHSSIMPNRANISFLIRNGLLKIKLDKPGQNKQKLYIYDAKTQLARELPLDIPADVSNVMSMHEETVEATKHIKLDTRHKSPDGYELTYVNHSDSALVNKFLLSWQGTSPYLSEPVLSKSFSKVKLTTAKGQQTFTYGRIQFLGWVKP